MQPTKEELEYQATLIKQTEERIKDLEKSLKAEVNVRKKLSMQQTLKINRVMLEQIKKDYWRDV